MPCLQERDFDDHSPPRHAKGQLRIPNATLLSLPYELLTCVAMELDMYDVLRLRKICRSFNKISRSRQVWHGLLRHGIGTSIPKPFFLSKPLKESSAADVENDLQRWETGWSRCSNVVCTRRLVTTSKLNGLSAKMTTMFLLPGGRWLVSGYADGSVWYFDLSGSTGRVSHIPLLPSPFASTAYAEREIQIKVSVDFTSSEALGPSVDTHHLQQFHIAVVTCPEWSPSAHTTVDIWRVHVGKGQLVLGSHLSSFTESPTTELLNCSLYGPSVGYTLKYDSVIVDWVEAKSQGIIRYYLPSIAEPTMAFHLLPGDMLLAGGFKHVALYDWRSSCLLSAPLPDVPPRDVATPFWRDSYRRVRIDAVSQPMIIGHSIRLTLPTADAIFGMTVSLDKRAKERVHVHTLLGARIHALRDNQAFGYHRGVGYTDYSKLLRFQYRWTGEPNGSGAHGARLDTDRLKLKGKNVDPPGRLLCDQYTNRTVLTDFETSRFVFVELGA